MRSNDKTIKPTKSYHLLCFSNHAHLSHQATREIFMLIIITSRLIDDIKCSRLQVKYERDGFKWDEHQQGLVLGAFFWLHFLLQLPGGILAAKYGTKLIFGYANLIGCLLCCLMPIASYIDYNLMICLRVFQGIVCSAAWPSMHHM